MTPRLRHVFAEAAYWAPSLETNNAGHTAFNFTLPDSLTTWKLHAVGSTLDGRLTEIDRTFKTFQPFFVDLDAPQVLTVGDEITLPVNLRNYTGHAITLPVTVKPADWFTLSTPADMHATIASNGSTPVLVGLHAASSQMQARFGSPPPTRTMAMRSKRRSRFIPTANHAPLQHRRSSTVTARTRFTLIFQPML